MVVDCSPSARVPVGHRSERCGGDTHSRCKSFADRLGRRIRNHILPHVLKMVEGFGDQNMGNTTPGAIDGMKVWYGYRGRRVENSSGSNGYLDYISESFPHSGLVFNVKKSLR